MSDNITQAQMNIKGRQMQGYRQQLLDGTLTYEQFSDKQREYLGTLKSFREQNANKSYQSNISDALQATTETA